MAADRKQNLVEAIDLKKYFEVKGGMLHAVDGVSFSIQEGKTLGVVGESGCGKTTLGRLTIRLLPATGGKVLFRGENIFDYTKEQMKVAGLATKTSIIFQDPYSSLNPRMTVSDLIADPILINRLAASKDAAYKRVRELMEIVGLARRLELSYPHELDGGRRQRVGIARALAVNPSFIVCDEPVSALDVSIQAQILNLLMDLQEDMGLTYMFISHNLAVVRHISDTIMVMYMGKCVEYGDSEELLSNPLHPYTRALLSAIPVPSLESKGKEFQLIKGEISNPVNPKPGCRFAPRCECCSEACTTADIPIVESVPGHYVACTLYKK